MEIEMSLRLTQQTRDCSPLGINNNLKYSNLKEHEVIFKLHKGYGW